MKSKDIFRMVKINHGLILKQKKQCCLESGPDPKKVNQIEVKRVPGLNRPVRMQSDMIDSVLISHGNCR